MAFASIWLESAFLLISLVLNLLSGAVLPVLPALLVLFNRALHGLGEPLLPGCTPLRLAASLFPRQQNFWLEGALIIILGLGLRLLSLFVILNCQIRGMLVEMVESRHRLAVLHSLKLFLLPLLCLKVVRRVCERWLLDFDALVCQQVSQSICKSALVIFSHVSRFRGNLWPE